MVWGIGDAFVGGCDKWRWKRRRRWYEGPREGRKDYGGWVYVSRLINSCRVSDDLVKEMREYKSKSLRSRSSASNFLIYFLLLFALSHRIPNSEIFLGSVFACF